MIVDQRELIRRGARNFGNKKAIVYKAGKPSVIEGVSLTFHEVNERANKLANALGVLGLDPGTRVGTLAQNCLEYTEIMFGLIKGGLPQTILNPNSVKESLEYLREVAKSGQNLVPPALEAVRAYSTIGEMCDVLRDEFGEYQGKEYFSKKG